MLTQSTLTALIGIAIVTTFVALAVGGLLLFQRLLAGRLPFSEETNNDVIFFASAIGVFYSLIMGLIAVGVWTQYTATQDIVSEEAAAIGALYRDASGVTEPTRTQLQQELRTYTAAIIEREWPAQMQGVMEDEGTRLLDEFEGMMYAYEPQTAGQEAIYAELLLEYNRVIELRRRRIDSLGGTLPDVMWAIILVGAFLAVTVTYLLKIERPTQIMLTAFLALFIGLVVFVIYGMDNPLSGPLAIDADSYQLILDRLINLR